jgi:uncharacterized protein (TIGR03083 family)
MQAAVAARTERGLLVRAVRYALSAARLATPQRLPLPTPCDGWDLRMLLHHVGDSMDALSEGLCTGFVGPWEPSGHDGPEPAGSGPGPDSDYPGPGPGPGWAATGCGPAGPGGPVSDLVQRAATLLCACAAAGSAENRVAIGDRELTTSLLAMTGAVEIAVHGWDISVTCGGPGALPPGLASDLLPIAALLASRGLRAGLFADPVPVTDLAGPDDRLVAFLGRRPLPVSPGGVT